MKLLERFFFFLHTHWQAAFFHLSWSLNYSGGKKTEQISMYYSYLEYTLTYTN